MRRNDRDSLNAYIELHERSWGMRQYSGRPKLDQILKAPVVVFWRSADGKDDRWTITLHENLFDLEKYFTRLLFRSNVEPPKRRVAKIFKDGKAVIVRGVKILFQEIDPS
ncbi:MAG: hypothetical protein U0521_31480 [Anaerolineae bacterium]